MDSFLLRRRHPQLQFVARIASAVRRRATTSVTVWRCGFATIHKEWFRVFEELKQHAEQTDVA